jgi:hypothetical protein
VWCAAGKVENLVTDFLGTRHLYISHAVYVNTSALDKGGLPVGAARDQHLIVNGEIRLLAPQP